MTILLEEQLATDKQGAYDLQCGVPVKRCSNCGKSVAKSRVRRGLGCPKCPGAEVIDSTCREYAGCRTDHVGIGTCWRHGGKTPRSTQHYLDEQEERSLRQTANRLGIPKEIEAGQGLFELIWEAAGNVEFYRQLIQELPVHPEKDELEQGEDGKAHWKRGEPGIYGKTYHVSGAPTGEAKRSILLAIYDEERDRLQSLVKDALGHKLDERRVRIAESQVRELFTALKSALGAANLSPEQVEVIHKELARNLRKPAELESVAIS